MGPFEDKARGQLNVDEVVASGVAAAAPGTTTTTTGRAPGAGVDVNASLKMEEPAWNWKPSNQDFVPQPDVAQFGFDTGLVPVARTGQIPFPALANRQAANAERKAALEKKLQDFDLYAGIGSAADAYNRNFGKVARAEMDGFVDEIGEYLGIDDPDPISKRRKVLSQIATDPALHNMWIAKSKGLNEIGEQSQAYAKQAIDYLIKAEDNEIESDPELRQEAQDYLMGTGKFGTAEGPDVMTQVEKGRRFERLMSREKFFKDYITPGINNAMRVWQDQGKIDYPSGMVRLTETEKKDYDGLIDAEARRMSAMGYGSYEEVSEYLRKRLPGSVVVDTKLQSPASGGNSSSGVSPSQKVVMTATKAPYWEPSPGASRDVESVRLSLPAGGKIGVRSFNGVGKEPVDMIPIYIQRSAYNPDEFFIVGESPMDTQTETDAETTTEETWDEAETNRRTTDASVSKRRKQIVVPLEGNEENLSIAVQGQDWRSVLNKAFGQNTQAKPVSSQAKLTPQEWDAKWAALPKGGTLVGLDGKTYTKQ